MTKVCAVSGIWTVLHTLPVARTACLFRHFDPFEWDLTARGAFSVSRSFVCVVQCHKTYTALHVGNIPKIPHTPTSHS
jgi:hypothetical protein